MQQTIGAKGKETRSKGDSGQLVTRSPLQSSHLHPYHYPCLFSLLPVHLTTACPHVKHSAENWITSMMLMALAALCLSFWGMDSVRGLVYTTLGEPLLL